MRRVSSGSSGIGGANETFFAGKGDDMSKQDGSVQPIEAACDVNEDTRIGIESRMFAQPSMGLFEEFCVMFYRLASKCPDPKVRADIARTVISDGGPAQDAELLKELYHAGMFLSGEQIRIAESVKASLSAATYEFQQEKEKIDEALAECKKERQRLDEKEAGLRSALSTKTGWIQNKEKEGSDLLTRTKAVIATMQREIEEYVQALNK